MPAVSKTITINAKGLGKPPVTLTLAYIPKNADFQTVVPIAWKVVTLSEGDSYSYNWTDIIGGCRADIDTSTGVVTPEEYAPIPVTRSADMLKDTSKRPAVYYFTTATPYGQQNARVMNRTKDYVDVGAGFITNYNQANEEFNPIYVCPHVMDSAPAYVNYDPMLYIWASLDYAESELLDQSVTSTQSLWNQDVSKLTGPQITINVKRVNGVLVAEGPSARGGKGRVVPAPLVYKADLAFAYPTIVASGVKAIVDHLAPQGYSFKYTTKGYDTEAELEITLPPNVASCNQAELDLIAAIDANKTIFGKAFIKGHSGAILVAKDLGLETWIDINPATLQWYGAGPGDTNTNAAFDGKNKEDIVRAAQESVSAANGNGAASSGEAADAPSAEIEDTNKFASVRRGGRRSIPAF
ncbi:hypothetical protein PYCCODRAFT_1471512 [Trametes coccinea BRFM310]|uniref:Uncharacterized protein n=1 Tax=Trametes coccinea (strain BRFM310) TaxID=1353009 RepID=A0A1Y2IBR8_TRAC3|nr:hypothetical protein PYCCODRAFT_1471512 [Trametes coccinea BRFM310]